MQRKWTRERGIVATLIIVVLLIGGLIYWGINGTGEKEPDYVFLYADNQAEDYPTTLGAKYFAELVEERTEGRIRILVCAKGELGTEQEVIKQLQYGGIDFARVSLSQLTEDVPEMNALYVPYLYKNSEHMWKVLDGEIGDNFLNSATTNGMVGLSWYDAGARNFYNTNKPITCLEDMKGLKIRVQKSDMMVDTIEALGAEAVEMDYEEIYSGLERGTIQGAENNWSSYASMQHYEVAKYYTVDEHIRIPEIQICSEYTWERLGDRDREIVLQCAKESALYERELWVSYEEESRKSVIENGTTITELSEEEKQRFRDAVQPVYEKYCGEYLDIINQILEMGE